MSTIKKQSQVSKRKSNNPDHLTFVTREYLNVTKRIESGLTKAFIKREDALAYARKKGSYLYDLFYTTKHMKGKPQIYGYAVPN